MAGYYLVCLECFSEFSVNIRICAEHVRETHHFAQTHDTVPGHHLADFIRTDMRARVLKSCYCRYARRNVRHRFKRRSLCIFDHRFYTLRPADVADLMRIHEDSGSTVRYNSPCVLPYADHGRLNVDVGVHESRSDILS